MTPPEIPDDVMDAASAALAHNPWYPLDCHTPTEDYEAAYYIQAVWAHLYAAALRHAASELERETSWSGWAPLRRMADEATP